MWDVAIIGSGFGGSLLAMIARRVGRSVVLLERGSHPRFAIGESSTPLADLLWIELATRYQLPRLLPFAKWGTWRKTYPEVACGLKRGFTFYHHQLGKPFSGAPDRSDQLLVAASPRDAIADTHWYRPDFDHFLVREAVALGVEYLDQCEIRRVDLDDERGTIEFHRGRDTRELTAQFIVDASNRRGPLVRALGLGESRMPHLPRTAGLYTHFRGVKRLDQFPLHPGIEAAPYPVDDAAVHHVFEGGWIWVLRFVNGIVSAGVAANSEVAQRFGFSEGRSAWDRLLAQLPTVARQFVHAEAILPFVHSPDLAFQTGPAAGPNWALLPSAAGFVDPLLSSGFTLTLLGIERLAAILDQFWIWSDARLSALQEHAGATALDLLAVERFVAALYARMGDFAGFTEIARLYFCAVIHGEAARRLGRAQQAGGYLLREHPRFLPLAREICAMALGDATAEVLGRKVDAVLQEFDVGGLADGNRRPWYPVLAGDLRSNGGRLGVSAREIERLIELSGL